MTIRSNGVLGWLAVCLLAMASPALAEQHEAKEKGDAKPAKAAKQAPSAEDRARMADAHQKMAECLRSTRPIEECHADMKKACHSMGEGKGCEMGHHPHGHAYGHDKASKPPTGAQMQKGKSAEGDADMQ